MKMKRILSGILAASLLMIQMPAGVFAEETQSWQETQTYQALNEENLSEEDEPAFEENQETEASENATLEIATPESAAEEKDTEQESAADEYTEVTDNAESIVTYEIPADAQVVASGNCGAEGDNVKWTVMQWDDPETHAPIMQLTISGSGRMEDYRQYTTRPRQNYYLNRLVVEEGVTSIGDYAFNGSSYEANYKEIQEIQLPSTIEKIGEQAFCWNLTYVRKISIDEANPYYKTIDDVLFTKDGKTLIYAAPKLLNRKGIYSVPEGVEEIKPFAFANSEYVYVKLPNSLTKIDDGAFNSAEISLMIVPDNVTYIGATALRGISEIVIPEKVQFISASAFESSSTKCRFAGTEEQWNAITWGAPGGYGTTSAPDVDVTFNYELPEKVELNSGYCNGTLFWEITTDGELTIYGGGDMPNFQYGGGPWISGKGGLATGSILNEGGTLQDSWDYQNCINKITIQDGITSIGSYAFDLVPYYGVNSIEIPVSVQKIGEKAFGAAIDNEKGGGIKEFRYAGSAEQWAELYASCDEETQKIFDSTNVVIENKGIENYVAGILENYLGWKITSAGKLYIEDLRNGNRNRDNYSAEPDFSLSSSSGKTVPWCDAREYIKTVEFGENIDLKGIANRSDYVDYTGFFKDCANLKEFNWFESETKIPFEMFKGCISLSAFTIPDYVTEISRSAFENCEKLSAITIPEGVTEIENKTFSGCKNLENVVIPNSVTKIGYQSFAGCQSLESIELPENITYLGGAFSDCENLKKINLPESITSIGADVFKNCKSLQMITLPEKITEIPDSAFLGCTALTNIRIPSNVTTIGPSAFMDCSNLATVIIPEGVTAIKGNAFQNCTSLTQIYLPKGVEIGDHAFDGCDNLKVVYYGGAARSEISADILPKAEWKCNAKAEDSWFYKHVSFFTEWDEENQKAWFDDNYVLASAVTENTDKTSIENAKNLVGKYVYVTENRSLSNYIEDYELLKIEPVEMKRGTVEEKNGTTLIIAGDEYELSSECANTMITVGDDITYFIKDNEIVGIRLVSKEKGVLTSWNKQTSRMVISGRGYRLSALANIGAGNSLGNGSFYNTDVIFETDGEQVYSIKAAPKSNYNDYNPTSPEYWEDSNRVLRDQANADFMTQEQIWEEKYKAYTKAVSEAVKKEANESAGVASDEKTIKELADEMQAFDEKTGNYPKYITFAGNDVSKRCKDVAYKALAKMFYENLQNRMNFGKVNTSDTMAGVALVKSVMNSLQKEKFDETIDGVHVMIAPMGISSAQFGKITCERGTKTYSGTISSSQKCQEAVNELYEQTQQLAQNAEINFAKTLWKELLGKTPSELVEGQLEKQLKSVADRCERKLGITLAQKFTNVKVGDVQTILNDSISYYKTVKSLFKMKDGQFPDQLEQMMTFKPTDTTVKDQAVKAALNALERQTNKLNTMIDKYMNGTLYKVVDGRLKLQVACPVEVSVYNMAGEQVAFVGNETSWATDGIEITQDGEEKSILVMNDEQLCFVITGTNEGVFTVSIEEQDGAGMAIGRLNYYDVPISADQSYEVTTKEGLEANGNDMPLVSENETVQADEYIAADRPKVVSISADAQADDGTVGGTVTGVGTYVPGDLVTLCAEPNDGYEFIGWFDGDTLKSVSSAYHFAAREDSMLCAQFYHDTAVHVNAYADGEGIALGGGSYQKGENVILVAIDDDDANVTFLGWFNGDAQVSAEREYQFTASEDVELTARWQTEPKYVLGDVNNDGKINVVDAYLIRCYAAQLNTLDDTQQLAADVNRDGRINVVDAYLVRCYAAQLIKEFPAA